MAAEPFCDFGGLPRDQCAHCREQRTGRPWQPVSLPWQPVSLPARAPLPPLTAAQVQRYVAARYGPTTPQNYEIRWRYLHDPAFHARVAMWEQMRERAFPPEHDWEALAGSAAVSYGPWTEAQHYGTCAGCPARWEPGEQIRFCEDEDGWVCWRCGSTTDAGP